MRPVAESAGMHLVLEGNFDDVALSQWLKTQGFGSTPLNAHYIGEQAQTGLVMGFASASKRQIEECVSVLRVTAQFPTKFRLLSGESIAMTLSK